MTSKMTRFCLCVWFCAAAIEASADHAVILSVSRHASSKYDLDVAASNGVRMEKAFRSLGFGDEELSVLRDHEVTRAGWRRCLRARAMSMTKGERLFVYYAGHGVATQVASTPVRGYFTYDTDVQGPDYVDLVTDHDLTKWLGSIRAKGVDVILMRECCFNGGGYSSALGRAAPGDAPRRQDVADIELSACRLGQSANAMMDPATGQTLGVFTKALAEVLEGPLTLVRGKDLAEEISKTLVGRGEGQELQVGGALRDFEPYVFVDARTVDVVLNVQDAFTRAPLKSAEVRINSKSVGTAPIATTLDRGLRQLDVEVSRNGYVTTREVIALHSRRRVQTVQIDLEPLHAVVAGRLSVDPNVDARSIAIDYQCLSLRDAPRELDSRVFADANGHFRLRVPIGHGCRLSAIANGEHVKSWTVDHGRPLEATAYDLGRLILGSTVRSRASVPVKPDRPEVEAKREIPGFEPGGRGDHGWEVWNHRATGLDFILLEPPAESSLRPYLIAIVETTQGAWARVKGETCEDPDLPKTSVSWEEAQSFATDVGLQLPSESQWEFACLAGSRAHESHVRESLGWHSRNSGGSAHAVGDKPANAWGLHDMYGNVWEWCSDDFDAAKELKVLKGGSYFPFDSNCAATHRRGSHRSRGASKAIGFRLVRSLK